MRTMYLIEHYAINRKNGVRTYIGSACVDYREKNLVMKSVKNHGYSTAGKRLWQEVEEQNKKTA